MARNEPYRVTNFHMESKFRSEPAEMLRVFTQGPSLKGIPELNVGFKGKSQVLLKFSFC